MQLDDLYRQVIMDHYQHPRNQGRLTETTVSVDLRNPSCGDEITLQLQVDGDVVRDVRFQGSGCSISMASASMMTEAIKGQSLSDALELASVFRAMIRGEAIDTEALGDLESLQGVSKFPARVKCALLAWQALEKAVSGQTDHQPE
ncbi:MAG: SUF system NifU family Fe-S cluster assembly protein [Alicyclobacillus herbarius]|uniref:Fe-S cluster assembly sulfur transfer protein SufU n=1 Tax=Alicyclobacillus herbarius TaxID=122960 RepID=UPI00040444E0|nr:SUF system NifU family Fe-S cluster assembly protein [Alicyclobacillus herbarius]MCL6632406.1 SUF system NifU family Fe-S cluster assembly protein [Alicyclobacillus herbarius]